MQQPAKQGGAARRGAIGTVGIAGGGQLAQMMLEAATRLGLEVVVMDPDAACSAAAGAKTALVGAFDSYETLAELARLSDVVTFEIERVDAGALARLEAEGHCVRPSAATLATIQDKLVQKQFLARHGIPTSRFEALDPPSAFARELPCVWKARRDGYDGRGVAMLRTPADVQGLPRQPALLEDLVDIDYELATLVARDASGTMVDYPVAEIVMDPAAHVMDSVVVPSEAPPAVAARCRALARRVAGALDYVGILALEFFVDRGGRVFVNEISPRPHNSGHYTIEACSVSQFEQHLRAVADLGLVEPEVRAAAVTFNVLGAPGARGVPRYVGFDGHGDADRVYVHCYDKPEVRPGRKMAHATVLAETRAAALAQAARIKPELRVESADE